MVISYNHLHFCAVSCTYSFFLSGFIPLGPIFLDECGNDLLILFIFSKKQNLDKFSLIFFYCFFYYYYYFLVSISFFLIYLYYFFRYTNLGFVVFLFLVPLGVRLDCLFKIFPFPKVGLYYKLLSYNYISCVF